MATKKVLLKSQVNTKDGEFNPGEEVDLDEKLADQVIASRGGVEAKTPPKKTTTKQADK